MPERRRTHRLRLASCRVQRRAARGSRDARVATPANALREARARRDRRDERHVAVRLAGRGAASDCSRRRCRGGAGGVRARGHGYVSNPLGGATSAEASTVEGVVVENRDGTLTLETAQGLTKVDLNQKPTIQDDALKLLTISDIEAGQLVRIEAKKTAAGRADRQAGQPQADNRNRAAGLVHRQRRRLPRGRAAPRGGEHAVPPRRPAVPAHPAERHGPAEGPEGADAAHSGAEEPLRRQP